MKQASETSLIEQIRQAGMALQSPWIRQSIGDDCAVIRPPGSSDLVFTTDFVLEGRHFTCDTHTPGEIGHKALARSLSDLAAMGATPLFFLVSLALPAAGAKAFVSRFYRGALALAKEHGIVLAGGDLASFSHVVADVMCCGAVPRGKAFLRGAAKPGDSIYVTGTLGHSAVGFRSRHGAVWKRHRMPMARVRTGMALRRFGVRCAMDLSDGLSLDLARLCAESNVSAELRTPLPLARGASLDDALHGGEDYELLFTAGRQRRMPREIEGVAISKIGEMVRRGSTDIQLDGLAIPRKGFDHFA